MATVHPVDAERQIRQMLLVDNAKCGDRCAMEELLLQVQVPLYRYLRGMVGDHAEDILQETLFQICRKIRYLRDSSAYKAWCYRLATRFALAHLRAERTWRDHVRDENVMASLIDPATEGEKHAMLSELKALAKQLPPGSRSVLLMHYCEELQLDEVAAILDLPLGTVKSRLAYGLQALRRLLSTQGAMR